MSKPEPPPLPSNTPSQFPAPPAPPQQKPLPQAFVEYITAFDKPLTKDEKVAWLGEIAHRVLNGELPQEVYPFLRDKIEGLPEALSSPNRQEEKIPGSDYVHPEGSKPYVPFIRENPTFRSTNLSSTRTTYRSKTNDSSFSTLIGIIVFFIVCFVAYGIGSWAMKSPTKKNDAEIASVVDDVVPVKTEVKTDNPFAEEPTDNPFEDGSVAIVSPKIGKYYRVEGKQLLGPEGKPVRLRGVLLYSFHHIAPEDIHDLKEMGVNYALYAVELDFPNDKYKWGSFDDHLVRQVKMLTDAGIRVVVSIFGRKNWRVDYRPYNSREFHREILAQWKEMIEKLDNNSDVIGWGIFWSTNFFYQDWMRHYDEMAINMNEYLLTEIRKIDPHRPIILPGIEWVFTGNPPKVEAANTMILLPFEHRAKFNANVPVVCCWGVSFDNRDLSEMKNTIAALEESDISWIYDGWFTRNHSPHGAAMNRKMTEKVDLMTKVMKSPDKFDRKSPQYDPSIWNTTDNPFEEPVATDNPFAE